MLLGKQSLGTAVLALLYHKRLGEQPNSYIIEPYVNGRETGWSVKSWASVGCRMVVFSENRSSDQIVLYCGRSADFSMQGNVPSDRVWREARYFDVSDVWQCVEAADDYLSAGIQQVAK